MSLRQNLASAQINQHEAKDIALYLCYSRRRKNIDQYQYGGVVFKNGKGIDHRLRFAPTFHRKTPLSFIDVLNEKQSAPAIGEWILQTACRQAARWQATIPDFRIGVNLFEAQLRTNRLLCTISTLLTETGLPASSLELEIVETSLFRNEAVTKNLLHGLRDIGVGLAFDDYGTGYASLSLLKTYPVSRLKIDRTFIHHVYDNAENAALVKAIIYLAENFGLDVIAEGVETEEQFIFLKNNECPEVQGYLFGRPVSAETFTAQFIEHKGPLNLSHAK